VLEGVLWDVNGHASRHIHGSRLGRTGSFPRRSIGALELEVRTRSRVCIGREKNNARSPLLAMGGGEPDGRWRDLVIQVGTIA